MAKWYWDRSHVLGISSLSPSPAPIKQPSYALLTPDTISSITKLARMSPKRETGPVSALAVSEDNQVLVAAYAQEGLLRHWHIEDEELLRTLEIDSVSISTTAFDERGELLVSAVGKTAQVEKGGFLTDTHDIQLHNAQTGDLIWSVDLDGKYDIGADVSAVALSNDGQWVAATALSRDYGASLFVCNTVVVECDLVSLGGVLEPYITWADGCFRMAERRIWETPEVVTFSPKAELIAMADREGRISLREWDAERGRVAIQKIVNIDYAKGNDHVTPLALEFDRSRRWLAVVRGERFELWSLDERYVRRTLSASIPATRSADIAFNPSSKLVAVGANMGWQIWDVDHGKKIAEGGDSSVFALTFSSDGHLFIWGDEDGIVHVSGIPE